METAGPIMSATEVLGTVLSRRPFPGQWSAVRRGTASLPPQPWENGLCILYSL